MAARELVSVGGSCLSGALISRVVPPRVAASDPLHLLAGDGGKVGDANIGLESGAPPVSQDRLEDILVNQLLRIGPVRSSRERGGCARVEIPNREDGGNPGLCEGACHGSQGVGDRTSRGDSEDENNLVGLERIDRGRTVSHSVPAKERRSGQRRQARHDTHTFPAEEW